MKNTTASREQCSKGKHILLDLQYDPASIDITSKDLMDSIFEIMIYSITTLSNMKIVDARKHELFQPPGFTTFICLDESHCSCHSYTDIGLLSLDLYTCGPTNPVVVMENIQTEIKKIIPTIEVKYINIVKRFHYDVSP